MLARSLRNAPSDSLTPGTYLGHARLAGLLPVFAIDPYQRIAASVVSACADRLLHESWTCCQYRGSAIARCSTTSWMVQLSGVIRNFNCARDKASRSLTSQFGHLEVRQQALPLALGHRACRQRDAPQPRSRQEPHNEEGSASFGTMAEPGTVCQRDWDETRRALGPDGLPRATTDSRRVKKLQDSHGSGPLRSE